MVCLQALITSCPDCGFSSTSSPSNHGVRSTRTVHAYVCRCTCCRLRLARKIQTGEAAQTGVSLAWWIEGPPWQQSRQWCVSSRAGRGLAFYRWPKVEFWIQGLLRLCCNKMCNSTLELMYNDLVDYHENHYREVVTFWFLTLWWHSKICFQPQLLHDESCLLQTKCRGFRTSCTFTVTCFPLWCIRYFWESVVPLR